MARVICKWQVPKNSVAKYGTECYHIKVGKVGLWLRWFWWGIWKDTPSWKRTKQLAREGNLMAQKWFVLCPVPFYTNFYYLK